MRGPRAWGGVFFTAAWTTRPGGGYWGMLSGPRIYGAKDCKSLFSTDIRTVDCRICKSSDTAMDKNREGLEVNCCIIYCRPRERFRS